MKTITAGLLQANRVVTAGSLLSYRVMPQLPLSADETQLLCEAKAIGENESAELKQQKWFKRFQNEVVVALSPSSPKDPVSYLNKVDSTVREKILGDMDTITSRFMDYQKHLAVLGPEGLYVDPRSIQKYWGLGMTEVSFLSRSTYSLQRTSRELTKALVAEATRHYGESAERTIRCFESYVTEPDGSDHTVIDSNTASALETYDRSVHGPYNPAVWGAESPFEHQEFLRSYAAMIAYVDMADDTSDLKVREQLGKLIATLSSMHYRGEERWVKAKQLEEKSGYISSWQRFKTDVNNASRDVTTLVDVLAKNAINEDCPLDEDYEDHNKVEAADDMEIYIPAPARCGLFANIQNPLLPKDKDCTDTGYVLPITPIKQNLAEQLVAAGKSALENVLQPYEIRWFVNYMLHFHQVDENASDLVLHVLERINHLNEYSPRYTLALLPRTFYNVIFKYCVARLPEKGDSFRKVYPAAL